MTYETELNRLEVGVQRLVWVRSLQALHRLGIQAKDPTCPSCGEVLHGVYWKGKQVAWSHGYPKGCRPTDVWLYRADEEPLVDESWREYAKSSTYDLHRGSQ